MITSAAILTDTTLCTGCEACVAACKEIHALDEDRPRPWKSRIDDLSSTRFTTNSIFASLNPSYRSDIDVTFSQPLLRGFGQQATKRDIVVANTNREISRELFEQQDQAYKDSVIPPAVKARVAIEAGIEQGWCKYLGDKGTFIGMTSYGKSGPANTCFEKFGITAEATIEAAKKLTNG